MAVAGIPWGHRVRRRWRRGTSCGRRRMSDERERERASLVLVGCNSGGGIWGVLGVTVIVREVG